MSYPSRTPLLLLLIAGCAQPPTKELAMAEARVAEAVRAEAAFFAPELLAEAEDALAEAQRLSGAEKEYRASLRAAAQASLRANEASDRSATERHVVEVRLRRLVADIGGLLEMAEAQGAATGAPAELEALRARHEALAAMPSIMEAYDEANRLKPEALALEQRFREGTRPLQ